MPQISSSNHGLSKTRSALILISFLGFFSTNANAEQLLKSTKTWEGGMITYPLGDAEITSIKLSLEEGKTYPYHCHPVPTLGYILKGTVEVETESGNKIVLKEGESAVEVLRTVHRGRAIGGDAEIIVFYAGATHLPTTVLPENDPAHLYCSH